MVAKAEKVIESNHKDLKAALQTARAKADSNENSVKELKKIIGALDDRLKAFIKNA